jgi:hypothetical protein
MPGLDPDIHEESQQEYTYGILHLVRVIMDCRVNPGNGQMER